MKPEKLAVRNCHRRFSTIVGAMLTLLFTVRLALGEDGLAASGIKYEPPVAADLANWSDQELAKMLDQLVKTAIEKHAVTDPQRAVYGMFYEYVDSEGRQRQSFNLDSMHDGLWMLGSMLSAHRVMPDGGYLDWVQQYSAPFYINVVGRSDVLFLDQSGHRPADRRKQPITKSIKGWVPRGWDDGQGYYLTSGRQIKDVVYDFPSPHLCQDVADTMLLLWLTTRDPAAAETVIHIANYLRDYTRPIAVVTEAEDVVTGKTGSSPKKQGKVNLNVARSRFLNGMYHFKKGGGMGHQGDQQAWDFYAAIAENLDSDSGIPAAAAWQMAISLYFDVVVREIYQDQGPARLGRDPGQNPPGFANGKMAKYASGRTGWQPYSRLIQRAWVAQGILPVLRKHPGGWESRYRSQFGDDTLVRIVDHAPESNRLASFKNDDADVRMWSDPKHLHLRITPKSKVLSLSIGHALDDRNRISGQIRINGETAAAKNPEVEKIHLKVEKTGGALDLMIPYTFVPGQATWMNGVDHGRYWLQINGGDVEYFYLLSSGERVIQRLELMIAETLQEWSQSFQSLGYLPEWHHEGQKPNSERLMGELGGYAHLVRLIAFILMDRDGTTEWQLIREQTPKTPLPARPLPKQVIELQNKISPIAIPVKYNGRTKTFVGTKDPKFK